MFSKKTFRIWWQKPRKVGEVEEERDISFLELFYDLAYVGIIYQITHALVNNLSLKHLFGYIALYAMVWFAWINGTLYHELHGNNDIRTRIFTFLQVFALAFIAIFAPTAFGTGSVGFALSYSAFLVIVTFLWWRSGVHDPNHRPLSKPYVAGFLATIGVFLISVFTPTPTRFYLWLGAILFALITPFMMQKTSRVDNEHRELALRIRPALVERFGLLTIIVLGEAMASVMRGASHHEQITGNIILLTILGLSVVAAMWWSYFDLVARRLPIQKAAQRMGWMYLHLPLTMSIGVTAAGLLYLLEHPEQVSTFSHWMVVVPVSIYLLCLKLIIQTLDTRPENKIVYRHASVSALGSAILILMAGFLKVDMTILLILMVILLVVPVYTAVRFWIMRRYNAQRSLAQTQYSHKK